MTTTPLLEAAAWLGAIATVLWQRALLPGLLLIGLWLQLLPEPAANPTTPSIDAKVQRLFSREDLLAMTRRQLQQLAGTRRNLTKSQLVELIWPNPTAA